MDDAPTSDDTPIPFVTVTNWSRAAALCGFNIGPLLREVGIDTDLLDPEASVISVQAMRILMERCVEETRRHAPHMHFPVTLGETFAFDYLSDLETFITTSPTLREAVPALQWLRPLLNPFIQWDLQEHGDQARLRMDFHHAEAQPATTWAFAESIFVTLCKFTRQMVGVPLWQSELTLRHPPQQGSERLASAIGGPVRFEQPVNALWFDRALLDMPLRGALPSLHETAARRVAQQVAQKDASVGTPPEHASLHAQIDALLRHQPALLGEGLDALAQALGLHSRTLQRRLRDEDASHSAIVARVRHDLARQWLTDPALSIEDISERLGFTDRRSFTQAFNKWQGQSPSEFRRQGNP
ncbi:AraC family transcriptional regulator [Aquabacterium soli]|uniref:AraC family transcriptional regulator n=1 Tax=Aquabacterium soli TaxID=2493092 RepID=A0A3R8T607_9BURK|nr:AraC family transcriptional regulator [Aquabacterium soli]RRS04866.1 AraC family transcriptional regulator [Aquabacterium soli]